MQDVLYSVCVPCATSVVSYITYTHSMRSSFYYYDDILFAL